MSNKRRAASGARNALEGQLSTSFVISITRADDRIAVVTDPSDWPVQGLPTINSSVECTPKWAYLLGIGRAIY